MKSAQTYKTIIQQRMLLALLWPFSALLISIREFRMPYAKNLFFFFCVFVGLTFIVSQNGQGADSSRYAQGLMQMHQAQSMSFSDAIKGLYSDEGKTVDIYEPLLNYFVSRFTGNPHILFLCYALVFGFFYSRNLWYVFDKTKGQINTYLIPIILLYALVCPIWLINGVRMWTALHVFVYGALPFLLDGNPKKLYWSGASMFFHFSFFIPVVILLSFQFLPKRWVTTYFVFFIVTSFLKEINIGAITNAVSGHLPAFLLPRVDSYTNPDYLQARNVANQSNAFHVDLANNIAHYFVYVMVIVIWLKGRPFLARHVNLERLFCYSLYSYGVAQILALVPSGGRFVTVANMFMYAFFVLFIHLSIKKIPLIYNTLRYATPFLFFAIIFQIWAGSQYFGVNLFIGNPISAFFINDTTSFMEFVKQVI